LRNSVEPRRCAVSTNIAMAVTVTILRKQPTTRRRTQCQPTCHRCSRVRHLFKVLCTKDRVLRPALFRKSTNPGPMRGEWIIPHPMLR
jgi:hypothetical protein